MKNQLLLSLLVCLIIPLLFPIAFRTGGQHISQLSGSPNPAKHNNSQVLPLPAAECRESFSGKDEIKDLMILQNKQINFWIP